MSNADELRERQPDLPREILVLGVEDALDLSWIVYIAKNYLSGNPTDSTFRRGTVAAVRDLMEDGYAYVGDYIERRDGPPFVRSWGECSEAIARIDREWSTLEHPPEAGDIVWLELTDRGVERGEEIADQTSRAHPRPDQG